MALVWLNFGAKFKIYGWHLASKNTLFVHIRCSSDITFIERLKMEKISLLFKEGFLSNWSIK